MQLVDLAHLLRSRATLQGREVKVCGEFMLKSSCPGGCYKLSVLLRASDGDQSVSVANFKGREWFEGRRTSRQMEDTIWSEPQPRTLSCQQRRRVSVVSNPNCDSAGSRRLFESTLVVLRLAILLFQETVT